ncbi:hypothetical protein AB0C64_43210, partial [Streptomyces sp900116325]
MSPPPGLGVDSAATGVAQRRGVGTVDPHFEQRPYDPWVAYGQSKSADVLFAVGARRLTDDKVTANAFNPGFILTNLQRHLDDDTMRAFGVMDGDGNLTPLPYCKTPAQGTSTSVLLAASPLVDGVTGRYFEDNQEARAVQGDEAPSGGFAAHALDPESADRLCSGSTPPRPSGSDCPRMLRPKRASGAAF